MIFYTYIQIERIRIFVIISLIFYEFLHGKAQIHHRFVVASRYLRNVSMHAVFSTQPRAKTE